MRRYRFSKNFKNRVPNHIQAPNSFSSAVKSKLHLYLTKDDLLKSYNSLRIQLLHNRQTFRAHARNIANILNAQLQKDDVEFEIEWDPRFPDHEIKDVYFYLRDSTKLIKNFSGNRQQLLSDIATRICILDHRLRDKVSCLIRPPLRSDFLISIVSMVVFLFHFLGNKNRAAIQFRTVVG